MNSQLCPFANANRDLIFTEGVWSSGLTISDSFFLRSIFSCFIFFKYDSFLRISFERCGTHIALEYIWTSTGSPIGHSFNSIHACALNGSCAYPVHQLTDLRCSHSTITTASDRLRHPSWLLHLLLTIHTAFRAIFTCFSDAGGLFFISFTNIFSILPGDIQLSGADSIKLKRARNLALKDTGSICSGKSWIFIMQVSSPSKEP